MSNLFTRIVNIIKDLGDYSINLFINNRPASDFIRDNKHKTSDFKTKMQKIPTQKLNGVLNMK